MFSLNVAFEELVLRSRKASPLIGLDKAFPDAWRVAGGEVCLLDIQTHVSGYANTCDQHDIQTHVLGYPNTCV